MTRYVCTDLLDWEINLFKELEKDRNGLFCTQGAGDNRKMKLSLKTVGCLEQLLDTLLRRRQESVK